MRKLLLCLSFLLVQAGCNFFQANCPEHFFQGEYPQLLDDKLARRTDRLCYESYAVLHSGISRTPLWSAEHLTAANLALAHGLKRKNAFHADRNLSQRDRAELEDYVRSGYDRGHMSPSGDMATERAQYESFSLANMVPQRPKNNQILWEGIEESTRNLTRQQGELYVITGPMFEGESLRRLNNRVLVPSHVFKAIYDPVRNQGAAYIAANTDRWDYTVVSLEELEKRLRINLFPKLTASVKQSAMALPEPQPFRHRRGQSSPRHDEATEEEKDDS